MRGTWQVSPILGVRNVREAAEYYRNVLGFDLDPDDGIFDPPGSGAGGVYAIVKRAGAWIHFQIRRGEMAPSVRAGLERDVYVYVDDLDEFHRDLRARGAVIVSPPQMAPHGIREMVVEDLNGYRLAFGELSMPR